MKLNPAEATEAHYNTKIIFLSYGNNRNWERTFPLALTSTGMPAAQHHVTPTSPSSHPSTCAQINPGCDRSVYKPALSAVLFRQT